MHLLPALFIVVSVSAHAEIYRCVSGGHARYTDRPCDASSVPAQLPQLNTIRRNLGDNLVDSHDERLQREKSARDKADAVFLSKHAAHVDREKAVRRAIINHQVINGMTPSEVESALGPVDEKLPQGGWRYRHDGQRTTILFKSGRVSNVSTTSENKKK